MESRLKTTLAAVLNVDVGQIDDNASPETLADWDSVKQMDIVLAIEDEFDVRFDDDVIPSLGGYAKLRDALKSLGVTDP